MPKFRVTITGTNDGKPAEHTVTVIAGSDKGALLAAAGAGLPLMDHVDKVRTIRL